MVLRRPGGEDSRAVSGAAVSGAAVIGAGAVAGQMITGFVIAAGVLREAPPRIPYRHHRPHGHS
jgi:hypothetical protein